jgi:HK97 gp10 family phage protein
VAKRRSIAVHGTQELIAALKALPKEIVGKKGGPLKSGMMSAMLPVLRTAQAKAPEYTGKERKAKGGVTVPGGRLKKAIKRRRHPNPRRFDEVVAVGVFGRRKAGDISPVVYASMVEFGTVKHPQPNPFLRTAMEENSQNVVKIFRQKARLATLRAAKKVGKLNDVAVRRLARS